MFSTVAKISTLRLVLAVAGARDYNLTCADIRQASLTEDLYMRVPPDLPAVDASGQPLVVKLRRSLYELRQAGHEWFQLFASTLRTYGFKPLPLHLYFLHIPHLARSVGRRLCYHR